MDLCINVLVPIESIFGCSVVDVETSGLSGGYFVADVGCRDERLFCVMTSEKGFERVERYQDLKREIPTMWGMKKVHVLPVVVGAIGSVTKKVKQWIEKLWIRVQIGPLQKTTLLRTSRILTLFKA